MQKKIPVEHPDDFIDWDKVIIGGYIDLKEAYDALGDCRIEPWRVVFFFEKALREAEEELKENPDSINWQRRKTEIEDYLKKIHKILSPENQQKETEALQTDNKQMSIVQMILDLPETPAVTSKYPEFKKDIPLLLEHGYIALVHGKLKWIKTKQTLVEYFGFTTRKGENANWVIIERLFDGIERGTL